MKTSVLSIWSGFPQDEIREYLKEWGAGHVLEEDWYEAYGDEEEVLFKGYDILNKEGKLK